MSELEVVAYERFHPTSGWLPVDESNAPHYVGKGQDIRALTPLAPAQAWQARALSAEERVRVLEEAKAPLTVESITDTIVLTAGYQLLTENNARRIAQAILAVMQRANSLSKLAASDADLIDIEARATRSQPVGGDG